MSVTATAPLTRTTSDHLRELARSAAFEQRILEGMIEAANERNARALALILAEQAPQIVSLTVRYCDSQMRVMAELADGTHLVSSSTTESDNQALQAVTGMENLAAYIASDPHRIGWAAREGLYAFNVAEMLPAH